MGQGCPRGAVAAAEQGLVGFAAEARSLAARATDLELNDDAAYTLALTGDFARATALDLDLGQRYPDSTLIKSTIRPINQATMALGQGKAGEAIRLLEPALPGKLRTFEVPTLLAEANLSLHRPAAALAEFADILQHRGVDAVSPLYPLAQLGRARALRAQDKLEESRSAYEALFVFWKSADSDFPLLLAARQEYAALRN